MVTTQQFFKILEGLDTKYSTSGMDRYIAHKIETQYIPQIISQYNIDEEYKEKIYNAIKEKFSIKQNQQDILFKYLEIVSMFDQEDSNKILETVVKIIQSIKEVTSYVSNDLRLLPPIFSSIAVSTSSEKDSDMNFMDLLDVKISDFSIFDAIDSSETYDIKDLIDSILTSRGIKVPKECIYLLLSYSEFYITTNKKLLWLGGYTDLTRDEQEKIYNALRDKFQIIIENIVAQLSNLKMIVSSKIGCKALIPEIDFLLKAARKLESTLNSYQCI